MTRLDPKSCDAYAVRACDRRFVLHPAKVGSWHLLGACQERNPKWRRDAAESFQRSLSLDPNSVDTLISLGDLYRTEGLISRAQSCYEDVLKISADHAQAKSRLAAIKKR